MKQVIEVRNLHKTYDGVPVVDDVSFGVEEGEIFGIIGPNGAGKTTTIESVIGLRKPDGGSLGARSRSANGAEWATTWHPATGGAAGADEYGKRLIIRFLLRKDRSWQPLLAVGPAGRRAVGASAAGTCSVRGPAERPPNRLPGRADDQADPGSPGDLGLIRAIASRARRLC